jgi:hypothetical protein
MSTDGSRRHDRDAGASVIRTCFSLLGVLVAAWLLFGCSSLAGADRSEAVATPAPISGASPNAEQQLVSDRFWAYATDYDNYGSVWESIDAMTNDVDLVVRGELIAVKTGERSQYSAEFRKFPPIPTTFGVVRVLEVLKGDAISHEPGTVEVVGLGWPDMTSKDMPSEEFLLFLNNDSAWRARLKEDPNPDGDDQYHYVRPNGYQAAFRNLGGVISLVEGPPGWQNAFGPFPSQLDGTPYAQAVEMVRQAVAGSQ